MKLLKAILDKLENKQTNTWVKHNITLAEEKR